MTAKFAHVCIRVLNLEKSVDFYEKAFGFTVSKKLDYPEDQFTLVYLKDSSTDFELELTYNYDQKEPYELGTGYSHVALYVDKLEEMHEKHKAMQFTVTDIKGLPGKPAGFYFITDPDGYKVEVMRTNY